MRMYCFYIAFGIFLLILSTGTDATSIELLSSNIYNKIANQNKECPPYKQPVSLGLQNMTMQREKILEFSCKGRKRLVGSSYSVCIDGLLSHQTPECGMINCNTNDAEVHIQKSRNLRSNAIKSGETTVGYLLSCELGYILDETIIFCSKKTWLLESGVKLSDKTAPACHVASEEDNEVLSARKRREQLANEYYFHVIKNASCDLTNSTEYKTIEVLQKKVVKFVDKCKPGYKLKGKRYAVCIDGQWSNPPPACQALPKKTTVLVPSTQSLKPTLATTRRSTTVPPTTTSTVPSYTVPQEQTTIPPTTPSTIPPTTLPHEQTTIPPTTASTISPTTMPHEQTTIPPTTPSTISPTTVPHKQTTIPPTTPSTISPTTMPHKQTTIPPTTPSTTQGQWTAQQITSEWTPPLSIFSQTTIPSTTLPVSAEKTEVKSTPEDQILSSTTETFSSKNDSTVAGKNESSTTKKQFTTENYESKQSSVHKIQSKRTSTIEVARIDVTTNATTVVMTTKPREYESFQDTKADTNINVSFDVFHINRGHTTSPSPSLSSNTTFGIVTSGDTVAVPKSRFGKDMVITFSCLGALVLVMIVVFVLIYFIMKRTRHEPTVHEWKYANSAAPISIGPAVPSHTNGDNVQQQKKFDTEV